MICVSHGMPATSVMTSAVGCISVALKDAMAILRRWNTRHKPMDLDKIRPLVGPANRQLVALWKSR